MSAKYDISWVMQVYLGDYNQAPKDHPKKFKRAVKSFLAMKDPRTQLIIVSDGCQLAHDIYFKDFSKYENIKYAFIEKTTPKLRDEWEGEVMSEYDRVGPRALAQKLLEGSLVTYLDSDDYLMPNAADMIRSNWAVASKSKDIQWMVNTSWYDNDAIVDFIDNKNYHGSTFGFGEYNAASNPEKIKGLRGKWVEINLNNASVGMYAFNYIHRPSTKIPWRDTLFGVHGGRRADSSFWFKLKNNGVGAVMKDKYYVRCRYPGLWEY